MNRYRNQSSRDKIYAVKNSMHKVKEEIEKINNYLECLEKKQKMAKNSKSLSASTLVPQKETIFCYMQAKDIENRMRDIRMKIDKEAFKI